MMRRVLSYLLLLSVLCSCGTLRKSLREEAATPTETSIVTREVGIVDPVEKSGTESTQEEVTSQPQETPAAAGRETTAAEQLSDQVIAYARTFLGTPYKLGASGPKRFDCSGFTRYVFLHFGYNLTQYTGAQYREGREVASYADLQKADLVFFGKRGDVRNIGHVGIVVSVDKERGAFRFIHASTSGGVVESDSNQPYYMMRYIGARRVIPDEAE